MTEKVKFNIITQLELISIRGNNTASASRWMIEGMGLHN